MKKIISILCILISTTLLSQHNHNRIEKLFEGKPIAALEGEISKKNKINLSIEERDIIDEEYQIFHKEINETLERGIGISTIEFSKKYNQLIANTSELIKNNTIIATKGEKPTPPKIINGPCVNMDFEQGTFNGWELTRGDVNGSSPYSYANEIPTTPGPYHTIYGAGTDPVTGISTNNPMGGAFSTRLGNGAGVGAKAARMKQTFMVDASNYMYTYSYAVIFESPNGHTLNELPYFTVRVFDQSGNSVPCGEYTVIANAANASGYQSTNYGYTRVLYQDWQTVFTNLSAYIGQNVTVEFTSGDCSRTGHFGYAYVDASCSVEQITASSDIICTGDSSILTAPAGAALYVWSNGATSQSTTVFAGGTYSCTMTPFQGGGCSVTLDITINENPKPTANFSSSQSTACLNTPILFNDASTITNPGVISNYQWDFGNGTSTPSSNGTITGVQNTSGTYTNPTHTFTSIGVFNVQLTVTSSDGCTSTIQQTVQINSLPFVVAGPDQTVCGNIAVTLNGSGANTYVWTNGVINGQAFNPPFGTVTYTVTGTDVNGCTNVDDVIVTVNPNPIVNAGVDQEVCNGNQVTLSATGATAFTWNNGVVNNVPFTQAVGTVNYTVTGTNASGCQATDDVTVIVRGIPQVDAGESITICTEDPILLNGTEASTQCILWGGGKGKFGNPNLTRTSYIPTTKEIMAGRVWLTLTGQSNFNCPNAIDSVLVTINRFSDNFTFTSSNVTCKNASDGAISVNITNPSNGPYTYALNGGASTGNNTFVGISPGSHQISMVNGNGCDTNFTFNITEPAQLNAEFTDVKMVTCNGSTNGQIEIEATGGTPGYNYHWVNNPSNNNPLITNLGPGTYTCLVIDQNGCQTQLDTIINQPTPLAQSFDYTPLLCNGDSTILASIVSGGIGPYRFNWNDVITASQIIVGAGTYHLQITDVNGCQLFDTIGFAFIPELTINLNNGAVLCAGSELNLNTQVNGGTPSYSYNWSHNGSVTSSTTSVSINTASTYKVTVTDSNGCQASDSSTFTVYNFSNSNLSVNASPSQICFGDSSQLTYSYTGQTPLQSIVWLDCSTCGSSRTISPTNDSIFYVQLKTVCGDSILAPISIIIYTPPVFDIAPNDTSICLNETVIFQLSQNNNPNMWSYFWELGGGVTSNLSNPSVYYTQPGNYSVNVTVSNGFGCSFSSNNTANVTVYPNAFADFTSSNYSETIFNPTFTFTNHSNNASAYEWNFGDGGGSAAMHPTHTFAVAGHYEVTLTALNEYGCIDSIMRTYFIQPAFNIYVPNAFTPDGNAHNNTFSVKGFGLAEHGFSMQIFDRWGEVIFSTNDITEEWDGTYEITGEKVQHGVYTWVILYRDLESKGHRKVGSVTIL